jgi:hypothetical protein
MLKVFYAESFFALCALRKGKCSSFMSCWNKVCSPIPEGGLGIRNLRVFNKALLGKWLWRYAHERESWWRIAIDAKFGSSWGGWSSIASSGPHGVGLWKNIRKGWSSFVSFTRFKLGNGSKIRFWDDVWCGELALKEAFPILYGLSGDRDACVADHMDFSSGSLQWDVSFLRAAHDWEVVVFASFYSLLYSSSKSRVGEDKLWWTPSRKGKFDVRSFYKALVCMDAVSFPWKSIWRTKVPLKVAFFGWSAAQGKILTLDNLRKRQVIWGVYAFHIYTIIKEVSASLFIVMSIYDSVSFCHQMHF